MRTYDALQDLANAVAAFLDGQTGTMELGIALDEAIEDLRNG